MLLRLPLLLVLRSLRPQEEPQNRLQPSVVPALARRREQSFLDVDVCIDDFGLETGLVAVGGTGSGSTSSGSVRSSSSGRRRGSIVGVVVRVAVAILALVVRQQW